MRKGFDMRMTYSAVMVLVLASLAAAVWTPALPRPLPEVSLGDQMLVMGGACNQSCLNLCNGGGCSGACGGAKGGTEGTLCGTAGSSSNQNVWTCIADGSQHNCNPTSSDSFCSNFICHCRQNTCVQDNGAHKNTGKTECSDSTS